MKRILPLALLVGAVACQDVAKVPAEPTGPTQPWQAAQAAVSGTTTRISPSSARNGDRPAIDGDRVVWVSVTDLRVHMYDLSTGMERQISSTDAFNADIDGDRIVWQGSGGPGDPSDIWVYDLSTGTERQLDLPGDQAWPAISGTRIVYEGRRFGTYDIFMYDLATETETVITTAPGHQRFPRISGDWIVWADGRDQSVYVYDLSTGTEQRIAFGFYPDISGDRIVQVGSNSDIYLYDLSTGTQRVISNAPREQQWPRISGDWIVWQDWRHALPAGTQPDIFLYDLSTDTETQITSEAQPTQEWFPAVSGNRIVWHQSGPSAGVYLFQGDSPPENRPPTASITSPSGGAAFAEGEEITFQGAATDPENGELTGDALVWRIPGIGQIGTGESFTRDDLPVGEHTVVLRATDSKGATATASVTFRIEAPAENRPPAVEIDSPEDGAVFTEGEAIPFRGSAEDPEDGALTGDALVWTVEGIGEIGTGRSFTRTLPVGTHTVVLTATDSEGLSASDQVTITVEEAPVEGPECGGFCFLPPTPTVSETPSPSGAFDGSLNPTVLVCEKEGSGCGPYVAGFLRGPIVGAAARITVDEAAEEYRIDWNTSRVSIDPAKTYRIVVFRPGSTLGSLDVSGSMLNGMVPIRFRIEE